MERADRGAVWHWSLNGKACKGARMLIGRDGSEAALIDKEHFGPPPLMMWWGELILGADLNLVIYFRDGRCGKVNPIVTLLS